MKIKLLLTMLVSALLVVLLSGCSSQITPPAPSGTTTTTTTPFQTSPATTSSPSPTYASELMVFAAAGTKAPIDAAAAAFEEKYGTKIIINYGAGGEVLSSMVLAKKGDVFISPEQRFMNSASKQGAVDATTSPDVLAYMIPVIGVQKGNPLNIQTLADLAKPDIKIAIGNPETTLLGEVVPDILKKAGLYGSVNPNIVTNVPQVNTIITNLKTKQVDAGFIWHYFGVTASNDVDIIWIPAEYVTGIGEIQAAVTTYSKDSWTAEQFVKFLASVEGQEFFKQNGYIVNKEEANKFWVGNQ